MPELTEAELQAKIDAAVAAANKELKEKNYELVGKIKKANEKADAEAEEKRKAEEKAKQDQLSAEGKHEEVLQRVRDNAEAANKELADQLAVANAANAKLTGSLRTIMVDNEINKQLVEAGVSNPVLLEAAAALISPTAEIVDGEGEEQVVKIQGKEMGAYFAEWKDGKGKAFITNNNSGGGSGGDGGGGGTDDWEAFFKPESANQTKQLELQMADPERYASLRKKYPLQNAAPIMM